MIIQIDPITRISLTRSNGQNAALLQILETNRWVTRKTRLYSTGVKGDAIIADMKKVHEELLRDEQYQAGLAAPYH